MREKLFIQNNILTAFRADKLSLPCGKKILDEKSFNLTSMFALIVFDSFLFYLFCISILFSKCMVSKIKHKEVQLLPG